MLIIEIIKSFLFLFIILYLNRNIDLKELLVTPEAQNANPNTMYDLIANIVHDGTVHDKGKIHFIQHFF